MKKKALAFAAMACSVAMLLSACGGSNSNAASGDTAGSNIITAYKIGRASCRERVSSPV